MDYYLDNKNQINRLVKEWIKYEEIVVAYDYDNTVYDYHNKGYEFDNIINLLRKCKTLGAKCIVFTCREEKDYDAILKDLAERDIPCDGINITPDNIPFGSGKKIYYNILLDDRAGLKSAYFTLSVAAGITERKWRGEVLL